MRIMERLQKDILTEVGEGNAKELEQIEDGLSRLQEQVVKNLNTNDEFNNLVKQIQDLDTENPS